MSFSIGGVLVNEIVCIHLQRRKDRVKHAKRQARKKQFGMRIHKAVDDREYPNLGKFESHLQCLQDARKRKFSSVLILEDDFKVLMPRLVVPHPPIKWDMLYLGGNPQSVLQDDDTDKSQYWKRVCCLLTHAYVVQNTAFDTIISQGKAALAEARKSPEASKALHLDQWYCNVIHPKMNVYITTPERVIQIDGFSDVQLRETTYRMRLTEGTTTELTPPFALAKPKTEVFTNKDNNGIEQQYLRLALPDHIRNIKDEALPSIALITYIRNQPDLFQLQQWRYYQTIYPREKMCWLVVDDSADELKVGPLIDGSDKSIKYVRCDMKSANDFISVSKKVNLAMKYLGPEVKYVLHVAPDALYPADHALNRVKLLMAYPEFGCIGSTRYGVYDVSGDPNDQTSTEVKGLSYEQTQPDSRGNPTMIFGPTLGYSRDWWMERSFDENQYTLETFYFIRGRWDRVLDVPYSMICVAITHSGLPVSETARYGLSAGKAVTSSKMGTARASTATSKGNHLDDGEMIESNVAAKRDDVLTSFESGWDMQTKNMMLMLGGVLGS
jgi:hypothetical protein